MRRAFDPAGPSASDAIGRSAATGCMPMIALAWLLTSMPALADQPTSFRLMSFNIWMGGVEAGQPLSKTVEVMKLADVVGVQEAYDEETDNSKAARKDWVELAQGKWKDWYRAIRPDAEFFTE